MLAIIEDGVSKVDLYLLISKSFKSTDVDSAMLYASRAKTEALQLGDDKNVAESFFLLGKIDLRRDSLPAARDNFYKALNYTNECNCDSLKASILMYLGKSYAIQDNYSEAITNFMKSLALADKTNNKFILADLLDDIGLVMAFLTDYEQAMLYFKRALIVQQETGDQQNYATTLRNIGFIYQKRRQYTPAEKRFFEALEIYKKLIYYPGISTSIIGIGNVEFETGNFPGALENYNKALTYAEKITINSKASGPYILALCYNKIGTTFLKLQKYSDSREALNKAMALSDRFGLPSHKANTSLIFSQLYTELGNIPEAFKYFKMYNALSDSIINARNVSAITKMQMEYQYLKKRKEEELAQIRKDEAYKRSILIYELLTLGAVVTAVFMIFIFVLFRKNQQNKFYQVKLNQKNLELEKENLQKELDFKNRELTTSVMYLLKKNNFIWQISEKLKEISLLLKPENQKEIKNVIRELDSNTSKDSWEEFESRFNQVHSNFYENLLHDFPRLTPNELKLSAFLKLNMTTKDIGTITYQSVQSITMARHRLRTKLGLGREENLVSFLSKY